MANILWFSEISNDDMENCGEKAVSLGEMYNIGFPIPPGFAVTAQTHEKFLKENRIDKQISNILSAVDLSDPKSIQKKSDEIQEIITKAELSNEIKDDIFEAYENLNVDNEVLKFGNKNALSFIKMGRTLPYIAVRSSNIKDYPGETSTYLNVKGNNALLLALKKCWASLFNYNSIYYREKNNISHENLLLSVIVQKMINPASSGLILTMNPQTDDENEIVIESVHGMAEPVILGNINPNSCIIDKEDLAIKNKIIQKQEYMIVREENLGKNIKRKIHDKEEQVLTDAQTINLAEYGKKIEKHYQKPLDIEFAIDSGKIFILQAKQSGKLKKTVHSEHKTLHEDKKTDLEEKNYDIITKVKLNLDKFEEKISDDIGLISINDLFSKENINPMSYLRNNDYEGYIEFVLNNLMSLLENSKDNFAWIKTLDFQEDNSNHRGIRRALNEPDILKCDFSVIKRLYENGFKNLGIILPFVSSADEIKKAKSIMSEIGLEHLNIGISIETPASVLIIEDLCKEKISFISFDIKQLTQNILMADKEDQLYNEMNSAVLKAIKICVEACRRYNIETSIVTDNESLSETAVKYGIDNIFASFYSIDSIKDIVNRAEKKLLLNAARKENI